MMEPNIARWATASLAVLLKPIIAAAVPTGLGLQFFVEGVDREQKAWFQQDSAVLRVTGPTPSFGAGQIIYRFEAMVMLTDLVDDAENGFKNHDRLGTIANALCNPIPVFAYGDGDAQVGCLDIDSKAKDFIRIVQFGKIDKDSEVVQGAVIVKYEICL